MSFSMDAGGPPNASEFRDLAASEKRFRDLANSMPQIVWIASADGAVHYLNDRYYDITGVSRDAVGDPAWHPAVHPEDLPAMRARWLRSVETGEPYEHEFRFGVPGGDEYRWSLAQARPARDRHGNITAWYGTVTDIHERKRREDHLAWLTDELDQRVKNNLAALISLAEQSLPMAASLADYAESLTGRMRSYAYVHEALTGGGWSGASLADLVRRVVESTVAPSRRVVKDGPDLRLGARAAASIAMVVHELKSNAERHGSLAGAGAVVLAWNVDQPSDTLRLSWREAPPEADTAAVDHDSILQGEPIDERRRRFGLLLADGIAKRQLRGRLDVVRTSAGADADLVCSLRALAD